MLGRTAPGPVCKWLRHFIANAPLRGTPLNKVLYAATTIEMKSLLARSAKTAGTAILSVAITLVLFYGFWSAFFQIGISLGMDNIHGIGMMIVFLSSLCFTLFSARVEIRFLMKLLFREELNEVQRSGT